jgi:GT2 family glycosyltransferase
MMVLRVLMACHNRRELTLSCLRAFEAAAQSAGVAVRYYIADDGSTDGTVESVMLLGLDVQLIRGSGNDYWAKSMAIAEEAALGDSETSFDDYLVWLNDDVEIYETALKNLLDVAMASRCVAVGSLKDLQSGEATYGGLKRSGIHPLNYRLVPESDQLQSVDTFNGNLVVVSACVALDTGGIDGAYSHGLADIDYGLRCKTLGIQMWVLPAFSGTCSRNPELIHKGLLDAWLDFTGTKGGGNLKSILRFLRKNVGPSGPIFLVWTYLKWCAKNTPRYLARYFNRLRGLGS